MQIWVNIVLALQLLTALCMIGLVLIQHGKGADMGASFGSGSSGSLFGATGSANFLSRSTAACACVFFACTLALAYLSNDRRPSSGGGSVLDRGTAASAVAPAASGPQIPGLEAPADPAASVPAASAGSAASAAAASAAAPASGGEIPK
jgi:preprotein translocase subunit SecG